MTSVNKKRLSFGTGGIRAIMGPAPDQMNAENIRRVTEGYARYLEERKGDSVVIAYDNRNHSEEFAKETARVLASHNITVFLFDSLRPTPELSFSVPYLHAFGGIVITASHNPPEYNGYKIYDRYGCQCVPRDTDEIIRYIEGVEEDWEFREDPESFDHNVKMIGVGVDEAYYKEVLAIQERPDQLKNLKIVYTPLHGTGYVPVTSVLSRAGYEMTEVTEQCVPDGNFVNASSPNPENRKSFDRAIPLAEKHHADLVIATDPDCDRIGIIVRHQGQYKYLTGNQTGAVLLEYLLSTKKEKGTLPSNGIVFDTIVTSNLGKKICENYGVETESTLTGFKFIGDKIREYEGKKQYLFGFEESCGYMIGTFTRDKDGVQAALLAAEAANYYKSKGKTLLDVLEDIYMEFGRSLDVLESETLPGENGHLEMERRVEAYRNGSIKEIEGRRVVVREDYQNSIRIEEDGSTSPLNLPKSNVVKLFLEDGSWVAVRPSGNEPKIKHYKEWMVP